MESETLGSRIRARRAELRISPDDLARSVGLSVRAISGIEAGIISMKMIADYLPKIAEELQTTQEALLNRELHSERSTRQELQRLKVEGIIRSDGELESVLEVATQMIRKRSRADIPLNRQELLNLIEVIRGAEALLNRELHSERSTRQELQRLKVEGIIRSDGELESVLEVATQMIRKRSRADIPLNRQELLNLIEVIRGADGL